MKKSISILFVVLALTCFNIVFKDYETIDKPLFYETTLTKTVLTLETKNIIYNCSENDKPSYKCIERNYSKV